MVKSSRVCLSMYCIVLTVRKHLHWSNSKKTQMFLVLCLFLKCLHVYALCKPQPYTLHNLIMCQTVLYARLVGTYYGMARASVRPSVGLSVHKACKNDTDWTVQAKCTRTLKIGTLITYDRRTNPIDFQGLGSKVKVTCHTLMLNLVNTIQTEPFKLGP